jgi:hypothetical protein
MDNLYKKLGYKYQNRILIMNDNIEFIRDFKKEHGGVRVDDSIDQRFPYEFMIVFVKFVCEVEQLAPRVLHNLSADGTLWFSFPKKSSKKISSDLDRDHGWEVLIDRGLDRVRLVSINKEWSAIRFRNARYIKSSKGRFSG